LLFMEEAEVTAQKFKTDQKSQCARSAPYETMQCDLMYSK